MEDRIFIGQTQPENNCDVLHENDNSNSKDCLDNVNMEFNKGNSFEIQERWKMINSCEDCFTRIKDVLMSYRG